MRLGDILLLVEGIGEQRKLESIGKILCDYVMGLQDRFFQIMKERREVMVSINSLERCKKVLLRELRGKRLVFEIVGSEVLGVEYDRILGDISIGLEFSTDWDNEKRHGYYDVILEKICIILDGRKKLSSRHIMGIIIHELRHAYESKVYDKSSVLKYRYRGTDGEHKKYWGSRHEVSARVVQGMEELGYIIGGRDSISNGELGDIIRGIMKKYRLEDIFSGDVYSNKYYKKLFNKFWVYGRELVGS